ncbi:MAG: transcription termination/antitermination factor NusG [Candidatus Schekmanbacteria bacterium]|nr:MAG: transcription termination/antitermination factor NusG [Candidatus Schekmanbacteria bacterium]
MAKKWYVVHAHSSYENKVKSAIEDLLNNLKESDKEEDKIIAERIGEILIPTENIISLKKGVKKETSRKFFPGYVLIEMDLGETKDDPYRKKILQLIKSIPKVSGFLGTQNEPSPLNKEEVERIIDQDKTGSKVTKMKRKFSKGDAVKIINGPFDGFTGHIEELNPERERAKVMVSIFGRATPVEFDFLEIERIT